MSHIFNSSVASLNRMPMLKFDMNQNQGRSFGPLLAVFLVNLLARAVTAKYYPYFPLHLTYDPTPWLPYDNKPLPTYNHHSYYTDWHPIKNPYQSHPQLYQNYPTLTTAFPYLNDYDNEYREDYEYYDKLIPAESNHIAKQSNDDFKRTIPEPAKNTSTEKPVTTTAAPVIAPPITTEVSTSTTPAVTTTPIITTTTETTTPELEPAGSSFHVRRQPTQKNKRKPPNRRDRYPQKRRRTTTTTPEYYDSYENYTEKPIKKRRRPQVQSAESYYDDEEEQYYDSVETTTRFYKKQKRRPTRRANKNQNRHEDSVEIVETSTSPILTFNPNTEIVIVRQAQSTTTPTTTTTTTGTTTTEPTTIITNSTVASTTPSNNGTYGYGPSNGNEYVSFTYGPPTGNVPSQYQVPYFDWYSHEATKNAIVKRVHDIVGFDQRLNIRKK